jgi:DNA-3-methyladenine glycosylase
VEVEAYGGPDDRASHARFTSQARNLVMAGRAGIAYVYLVYGMYDCLNVVTGPAGSASAVLIRAVEPLVGVERMREDRARIDLRRRAGRTDHGRAATLRRLAGLPAVGLASGPGLVAAAFGVDTSWTGADLCAPSGALRLERDAADPDDEVDDGTVTVSPRIGVAYAGPEWAGRPWRFAIRHHPSVSRTR